MEILLDTTFTENNKSNLDLSSSDLDGSHTTALRGGEQVAYQGRKKRKTTNSLYLTDRQGLPLAMSEPVSGNHNDKSKKVLKSDCRNNICKQFYPIGISRPCDSA